MALHIADGKRGLVNNCCIPDPVLMSHPDNILPYLYPGGYMAIVDASKCSQPRRQNKNTWGSSTLSLGVSSAT
jgi:hypothetical protein